MAKSSSGNISIGLKRKKLRTQSSRNTNTFEDLSNDILYEIFEYLDYQHAFQAFYFLNQRFQQIFDHSNLPIKINICSISKSAYNSYVEHIIKPHIHRVQTIQISNSFADQICLSLFLLMNNFTQLTTFIVNDITPNCLCKVLDYLMTLPRFTSLIVHTNDTGSRQSEIYEKLFCLPQLKYCKISMNNIVMFESLSRAKTNFSSIEHLVIKHAISYDNLKYLLFNVPKLRHLFIDKLLNPTHTFRLPRQVNPKHTFQLPRQIYLLHLESVSLTLINQSEFETFKQLITNFFGQVTSLTCVIKQTHDEYDKLETRYLDASQWENLISTSMTNLRIFNLQHWSGLKIYRAINRDVYENCISKFNTPFWTSRQWFFENQYYSTQEKEEQAFFYSINPFRTKSFHLYEQSTHNISSKYLQILPNSVSQVTIHSSKAIEQCDTKILGANYLILDKGVTKVDINILTKLNRIIPMDHLTRLDIDIQNMLFEQILQLVWFAPNIQTLNIDYKSTKEENDDLKSLKENHLFQFVSNQNHITRLTLTSGCTLSNIQLLLAIFPFIEFLTVQLSNDNAESIVRYLLSKDNKNTRYLSFLCVYAFDYRRIKPLEMLEKLFESRDLSSDFSWQRIHDRICVWI